MTKISDKLKNSTNKLKIRNCKLSKLACSILTKDSVLRKYFKLRQLIAIVCIVGLSIQVFELTQEYFSFKTRLNTQSKYGLDKYTELPAITICVDKIIDYDKLHEDFPHFEKGMVEIYPRITKRQIYNFYNTYRYLFHETHDFDLNTQANYSIDLIDYITCTLYNGSGESCALKENNTITTFTFYLNMICLTIFSINTTFPPFYQSFSAITTDIELIIYPRTSSKVTYNMFLALHSADQIPKYPDGFSQLKPKTLLSIKYWTKEWTYLKYPYNTDCDDYSSEYNSNYDCYSDCELRQLSKVCGECLPYNWPFHLRTNQLNKYSKLCIHPKEPCYSLDGFGWNENTTQDLLDIEFKCNTLCKVQCKQIEIESTAFESSDSDPTEVNTSFVWITQKKTNRILNEFIPVMSFANYVANIGGVGGFWVGLNVLAVYDVTVSTISYLSNKFKNK